MYDRWSDRVSRIISPQSKGYSHKHLLLVVLVEGADTHPAERQLGRVTGPGWPPTLLLASRYELSRIASVIAKSNTTII